MKTDIVNILERMKPVKYSTKLELYRRVSIAKEYIDSNLDKKLSLKEISCVACLSQFHFLRLFKQVYGQTPHKYIISMRLEKSRELIQETNETVTTICYKVGFQDNSSFGRLFKKTFGQTPLGYRRSIQHAG